LSKCTDLPKTVKYVTLFIYAVIGITVQKSTNIHPARHMKHAKTTHIHALKYLQKNSAQNRLVNLETLCLLQKSNSQKFLQIF